MCRRTTVVGAIACAAIGIGIGSAAAGPADAACTNDAPGDARDAPDVVQTCVTRGTWGATLTVTFADDVDEERLVGAVGWELATASDGSVALFGIVGDGIDADGPPALHLSDPFGRTCGSFHSHVEGATVTVPLVAARCSVGAADLFVAVTTFDTAGTATERAPDDLGSYAGPFAPAPAASFALTGDDPVGAALRTSQLVFADGTAPYALLARSDVFADALASGGAQGALGAPLLLTQREAVDQRVLEELDRLGVVKVFVLGGEEAMPATTVAALARPIERLAGATRLETARAIAERFPAAFTDPALSEAGALIVRAFPAPGGDPTAEFADALAGGARAGAAGWPVLLSQTEQLSAPPAEYLRDLADDDLADTLVEVVGGTAALSEAVVEGARAAHETATVERVAGATRHETAVAMARRTASDNRPYAVVVVDGSRSDAWVSGFTAAVYGWAGAAVIVLSSGDDLPAPARTYLAELESEPVIVCTPSVTPEACAAATGS